MGTTMGVAADRSTTALVLSLRFASIPVGRSLEDRQETIGSGSVDRCHTTRSLASLDQDA